MPLAFSPVPTPSTTHFLNDAEETEMLAMVRFMRQVVEDAGPGYHYPHRGTGTDACRYVYEGKPDCIGGRVLHRMGVSLDVLSLFEGKWCTFMKRDNRGWGADDRLPEVPLFNTTLRVLARAQQRQDLGESWTSVLEQTERLISQEYGVTA